MSRKLVGSPYQLLSSLCQTTCRPRWLPIRQMQHFSKQIRNRNSQRKALSSRHKLTDRGAKKWRAHRGKLAISSRASSHLPNQTRESLKWLTTKSITRGNQTCACSLTRIQGSTRRPVLVRASLTKNPMKKRRIQIMFLTRLSRLPWRSLGLMIRKKSRRPLNSRSIHFLGLRSSVRRLKSSSKLHPSLRDSGKHTSLQIISPIIKSPASSI